MLNKINKLKIMLLLLWALFIMAIVSNQNIDLDYLQDVKMFKLTKYDYTLSQIGAQQDQVENYRKYYGPGEFLIQYSDPEQFTNLLNFNSEKIDKIRIRSFFRGNGTCINAPRPDKISVHISVNDTKHVVKDILTKRVDMTLDITPNDTVSIYAKASSDGCGAVLFKMGKLKHGGDLEHYLLLNGLWASFIILMILSGYVLLPFFAVVLFYTYQQAELIYSKALSWEVLLLFSAIAMAAALAYSALACIGRRRWWLRLTSWLIVCLLFIVVLAIPLIFLIFREVFDTPMSKYDWFAILQTNLAEAIEFISIFAPPAMIAVLVASGPILFIAMLITSKSKATFTFFRSIILIPFVLTIAYFFFEASIFSISTNATSEYFEDAKKLKLKISLREKNSATIVASKEANKEVYVVILGESANHNHFSLYGYPRNTNPLLTKRYSQDDLIKYDQAYSNGISTIGSLKYALTAANRTKGLRPSDAHTIMEVLNKAGLETFWVHNGSTSIGLNAVDIIGEQANYTDHLSSIFGREDTKLLAEVKKLVERPSSKNKVIFLKTQGSHVPYCKRLPEDGAIHNGWTFDDEDYYKWLITDKYKTSKVSRAANCYDGTVKFTDYVIDETINIIEQSGQTAGVIYLADHGDEIVEGTAHMGDIPTYGVFSIPMFLWFSESYQHIYKNKYQQIKENANRVFVNDSLFDSLLGIMSVNYGDHKTINDISSDALEDGKWVYRAKKTVYDLDNYIYHTPHNLAEINARAYPYDLFYGPIEHPFHLAAIKNAPQINRLAFAIKYENKQFFLDSPLYTEKLIKLETVLNYLDSISKYDYYFKIAIKNQNKPDLQAALATFNNTLKFYEVPLKNVTIASDNQNFLSAIRQDSATIETVIRDDNPQFIQNNSEALLVDLQNVLNIRPITDEISLDIQISQCDITNCKDKLFQEIEDLPDRYKLRRVIIPMFDL